MQKFTSTSVVVVLGVISAVFIQCVAAQTVHVVGDSLGWSIPPDGAVAYDNWAANRKFVVSDILTFNFATSEHDVLHIPKESYDSCSLANPIGETLTRGPVNITLSNAGNATIKLVIFVSGSLDATPPTTILHLQPKLLLEVLGVGGGALRTSQPVRQPVSNPPAQRTAQMLPADSSSSGVFASFFITLFPIVMGFLL
ncbi:hypothetical protein I3843_01G239500 [Carya illinoinensis]|nr:hypothetical protein I3843_01G239500 [Carya illinoinensis]